MKNLLPIFTTIVISAARLSFALPTFKAKLGPAVLAKAPAESFDAIFAPRLKKIKTRQAVDDLTLPDLTPEQQLLDLIEKSVNSLLQPIQRSATLKGLKLKTSLELERENNAADSTDLVAGDDVDYALDGLKFKATIELESGHDDDDDADDDADDPEDDPEDDPDDPEDDDDDDTNDTNDDGPDPDDDEDENADPEEFGQFGGAENEADENEVDENEGGAAVVDPPTTTGGATVS